MKRVFQFLALLLVTALMVGAALAGWYIHTKQVHRSGAQGLTGLQSAVQVRYDERGVPHIRAEGETDLYRTLGYVHAQDRLFQMEMVRRLAQGELAEVLGPRLVDVDRLFRTLGLRAHAQERAARLDPQSPSTKALLAYLDGINQFQATHPAPLEFDVLGIPKRLFTPQDTLAVAGYLAYSFAAALRTEPVLTYVRDKLGAPYLNVFDIEWHAEGVLTPPGAALQAADWQQLDGLAQLGAQALARAGVPALEGSNAWAVSGRRTTSGKPLLAGDPHIAYAEPSVWYEAHLSAPGFELYGHHQALNPTALLGHNAQFGWSLTMFQNDDMDLIAEKVNPANANQVWYQGQWVDMQVREEVIAVKGAAPVKLSLRRSPHGPIITDAVRNNLSSNTPIAMWWAFLETENPILEAFYQLNRADTLEKARAAASQIHAPGLNVVWANAAGHIGWWAAAKLPIRPDGVNPAFILDGSTAQADKLGFYRFSDNPQEEDPARGYIVSANHQPRPSSGVPVPGYYNLPDRAQRLQDRLSDERGKWDIKACQTVQLETGTGYAGRILTPLVPVLNAVIAVPMERALLESLASWDGTYTPGSITPTVFNQFIYELARAAMSDELGETQFKNLLSTRALDLALPRLAQDPDSPWWNDRSTAAVESRSDIVRRAWRATINHLQETLGQDPTEWSWGRAHTLTHNHPLAAQKPLDRIFNVGPFAAAGGREVPNNLGYTLGPAPWAVSYGPSTRRVIDFADPQHALGINPVGQSGVLFDAHYQDQAQDFVDGKYAVQYLMEADIAAHTRSTLTLNPAR